MWSDPRPQVRQRRWNRSLREQVIAPILAGVRRPGPGRPPKTRTRIDRDYEHLRDDMRTLLHDLSLDTAA